MPWIERVRTEQPLDAGVGCDPEFNVASVITAATRFDAGSGKQVANQANVVTRPDKYGLAYRGTSVANNTKVSSGGGALTSGCYVGTKKSITVGARFKLNSTATNQSLFSDMDAGGFDSIVISYITATGRISCAIRNTSNTGYSVTFVLPDPTGWHDVALVHLPGQGLFGYLDGVLFGSQTVAGQGACTERYNSNGDPSWLALGSYPSLYCSDATIAVGYILAGDYRGFIQPLSANPWQLFAKERIWVPVAAGGNSTITQADGTSTAGALNGSSTAATAPTQAAGTSTAASITGGATVSAGVTGAAGTTTAATLAGVASNGSAIAQANGTSTVGTLTASAVAAVSVTSAAGTSTASTLSGSGLVAGASSITPAAGSTSTSSFAASSVAASIAIAAAGATSAATMVGTDGSATFTGPARTRIGSATLRAKTNTLTLRAPHSRIGSPTP